MHKGICYALLAALLFGTSTPLAKLLIGHIPPLELASVLYLGSGIGLAIWLMLRFFLRRASPPVSREQRTTNLSKTDWPWLAAAIATGGIAGPLLLMTGLAHTPASTASLLLNIESVATALIAWCVFRENVDNKLLLGMILIVAAGVLLAWQPLQRGEAGGHWGPLAIIAACICWGMDNNFTRNIAASDAVQIACIKGLVAGTVNLVIALSLADGTLFHSSPTALLLAGLVGFCGYGVSLVLFVLALRHLGSARTGAWFSAAPFAGALIALIALQESPTPMFWLAAALMLAGLYLHLRESHAHQHVHEPLAHAHPHSHDEHHRHQHNFSWDGHEPHSHPHRHVPLIHSHPHFPDIHHRHRH